MGETYIETLKHTSSSIYSSSLLSSILFLALPLVAGTFGSSSSSSESASESTKVFIFLDFFALSYRFDFVQSSSSSTSSISDGFGNTSNSSSEESSPPPLAPSSEHDCTFLAAFRFFRCSIILSSGVIVSPPSSSNEGGVKCGLIIGPEASSSSLSATKSSISSCNFKYGALTSRHSFRARFGKEKLKSEPYSPDCSPRSSPLSIWLSRRTNAWFSPPSQYLTISP
mmetsp:Transcript_20093/g.43285  ORF Transcript_20093/g.43285 Transcript_20093/m.43285 type:complete len:226 (+) Transcript_20093:529-1206(+)